MAYPELPKFTSEADEARWWFEHREEVGKDIRMSAMTGHLGEGSRKRYERKIREACFESAGSAEPVESK